MEKTIKQIADSLNLDKQKVYRFIKKNNISEAHQKNGTKYYSDTDEQFIIKHFKGDSNSNEAHQGTSNDTTVDAVISMLKEELNVKNKQIDELQNLLSQQQQLQLMEQKKMHLLLDEAKQDVEQQKNIQTEAASEENKGFFARLFNKH